MTSIVVDTEFLHAISYRLPLFKQVDRALWNFRCPICLDSKKNPNKARGYMFTRQQKLFYRCHNCQASMSFGSFLKEIDKNLYDAYLKECYADSNVTVNTRTKKVRGKPVEPPRSLDKTKNLSLARMLDNKPQIAVKPWTEGTPFIPLLDLDEDHPAVQYIQNRKIPKNKWSEIGYIDSMREIPKWLPQYEKQIRTYESRVVFPFKNIHGKLIGVTCRAMGNEMPRYVELKIEDDVLCFGLDKIDVSKDVIVMEGGIDSCFVDNSIGLAGMALQKVSKLPIPADKVVLVLDNQPKHSDVLKAQVKLLEAGYRVCIWPSTLKGKDVNDMILSGEVMQEVMRDLILKNSFSGLEGILRFDNWKKLS